MKHRGNCWDCEDHGPVAKSHENSAEHYVGAESHEWDVQIGCINVIMRRSVPEAASYLLRYPCPVALPEPKNQEIWTRW